MQHHAKGLLKAGAVFLLAIILLDHLLIMYLSWPPVIIRQVTVADLQLISAIENREFEKALAIISNDPSTAHAIDINRHSALAWAAERGNLEVVKSLIAAGADIEGREEGVDDRGTTPLHIASGVGWPLVVEELLKHGAAVNARNQYGSTPLHTADYSTPDNDDDARKVRSILKANGATY